MKQYKILFLTFLTLAVFNSCLDEVSTDYATLTKPVVGDDLSNSYSVKYGAMLTISPTITYSNMDDLSYEWQINGKVISTSKDLEWVNDSKDMKQYGVFSVRRNSAGNADIYPFLILRDIPYKKGFTILSEADGHMTVHMLQLGEIGDTPAYAPTMHSAVSEAIPTATANSRLMEYWSCEKSVVGELMYINSDPTKCFSMDGVSLDQKPALQDEFLNETLPEGLVVKDIMYGGFVSYVLSEDGKLYRRIRGQGYYTGRYSKTPFSYNGVPMNIDKLISIPYYNSKVCMLYGRDKKLYVVNTDYDTGSESYGENAGKIFELTAAYDQAKTLVSCTNIIPTMTESMDGLVKIWALYKNASNNYYARQFRFSFDGETITGFDDDYSGKYISLPDVKGNSLVEVAISTYSRSAFATAYIYYTDGTDKNSLWVRQRSETGLSAATKLHDFGKEITAISNFSPSMYTRLALGFADGSFMLYGMSYDNPEDYTVYNPENVLFRQDGLGKIVQITTKYGTVDSVK